MSDDIETRALAAAQKFQEWHANSEDADTVVHQSAQSDAIDYINAVQRLVVDRTSLRKALDDRHAADKKAWSAIMRATGKERGIPPNKEVIAWHVAEVERLEKVLAGINVHRNALLRENDSLRAKLDRAIPIVAAYAVQNPKWMHPYKCEEQDPMGAHALLSELSADAPAQETQITPCLAAATAR